ncbi:hypothetical protein GGI25_004704 [Coemansia spiralis]|uniref:Arrestin-like N-terminal domain-containing protein n=2 Tax=Coemansia TaxID=4863 RepID=A0A9W8KX58_9FUNG|nr:hypothetical protein BX070DRAFT_226133 [Coemansia spiralis]KAJ1989775.1 hypothetical protein EDC05_004475 [Coemansia umbellata]KAJ2621381.1 hypothetical protein GGI26_004163 [Coemansia sp. RSA 1358]KAJ2673442.1 hypothetical protein GGI25_004704 [Coemansia spiralis]
MDTQATLEIRFPAYTSGAPPKCTPKSTLAGVVCLYLPTATTASCLSLSLIGTERISLAPPTYAHMKPRSVKKVYFNQSLVLWGDTKLLAQAVLPEGIHMFHFACEFPRANYPRSQSTSEYEIKYTVKAKLLCIPRDNQAFALLSASQAINFVPETIVMPLSVGQGYSFCDNVYDTDGQWAFHLEAMGLKQAFVPGDTVDLQIRLTGRQLRRAQYVVLGQTDCFYPMIPTPQEEQLDLGRRLWSMQNVLCDRRDVIFERDTTSFASKVCAEHSVGNSNNKTKGSYYAHLHFELPRDLMVVHETGYLRFTYYAELVFYSTSWSGQVRRAHVRVPIPIASQVLTSSAVPTKPDSLRKIVRLPSNNIGDQRAVHRFIPKRLPSLSPLSHKRFEAKSRAVSFGRVEALRGHQKEEPPLRNQQLGGFFDQPVLQHIAETGCRGGFSSTFLHKLSDLYHVESNRRALVALLEGHEQESVIIPSAMTRIPSTDTSRSRLSVQSVASIVAVSERMRPKLEAVMVTYRNPGQWSALGSTTSLVQCGPCKPNGLLPSSRRPDPAMVAGHPRHSRLSAISVSSNDTACVSNGRLSLAKDIAAIEPQQLEVTLSPTINYKSVF